MRIGRRLTVAGGQEPGSNEDIQQFCQLNYGVSFPVLGKVDVNGDKADPVYKHLKSSKSGLLGLTRIKYLPHELLKLTCRWNFV